MSMIHTWRLNPQKATAWNSLLKSLETEASLKLVGDFWSWIASYMQAEEVFYVKLIFLVLY